MVSRIHSKLIQSADDSQVYSGGWSQSCIFTCKSKSVYECTVNHLTYCILERLIFNISPGCSDISPRWNPRWRKMLFSVIMLTMQKSLVEIHLMVILFIFFLYLQAHLFHEHLRILPCQKWMCDGGLKHYYNSCHTTHMTSTQFILKTHSTLCGDCSGLLFPPLFFCLLSCIVLSDP